MDKTKLMASITNLILASVKIYKVNPELLLEANFEKCILEKVRKTKNFQGISFIFQNDGVVLTREENIPILNKAYIGMNMSIQLQSIWEECIDSLNSTKHIRTKLDKTQLNNSSKLNISVFVENNKKFIAVLLKERKTRMSNVNTFKIIKEYYGNKKIFIKEETYQIVPALGESTLVHSEFFDVENKEIPQIDDMINNFNII